MSNKACGLWAIGDIPAHLKDYFEPCINSHPTIKPISLCKWIASLLLPPAEYAPRRILVPFCGSGSEMAGAALAGWDEIVGIDNEPEYVAIAEARMRYWSKKLNKQQSLFKEADLE